ncbi:hypothetical protein [Enterococcus durans]|uniref:hypothetical protein n=1 Tax=Enterococcus durans TaxID=53345 RepID=UPI0035E020A7
MSEDEKALTDAYYWLSMYKSGAITEGVAMEKVKEAMLKQPQLNDNQQIVLEWLEEYYAKSQWPFPFYVLKHAANDMSANIFGFYDDFTMKEEFEVLAAFAQWGLEQEDVE